MFYIAIICLVLLLALNIIEIVMRYIFDSSNVWSQEVSLVFVCGTIFFGFAKVVVDEEDISITFVKTLFTERIQLIIQSIVHLLLMFTSGYMFYQTISLMLIQLGQKTLIAKIPYFYYSFPLVTVLLIICLHSFIHVIDSIKRNITA